MHGRVNVWYKGGWEVEARKRGNVGVEKDWERKKKRLLANSGKICVAILFCFSFRNSCQLFFYYLGLHLLSPPLASLAFKMMLDLGGWFAVLPAGFCRFYQPKHCFPPRKIARLWFAYILAFGQGCCCCCCCWRHMCTVEDSHLKRWEDETNQWDHTCMVFHACRHMYIDSYLLSLCDCQRLESKNETNVEVIPWLLHKNGAVLVSAVAGMLVVNVIVNRLMKICTAKQKKTGLYRKDIFSPHFSLLQK